MPHRDARGATSSNPRPEFALTGPQQALADFLGVDMDLLAVAAEASGPGTADAVNRKALAAFIAGLPAADKDTLLLEAALGTALSPGPHLLARYRATTVPAPRGGTAPRSAAELLDLAHARRTERRERERVDRAAAERNRARAAAEAREAHLDRLARDVDQVWQDVDNLIARKKPGAYDSAVALLADLREVEARTGGTADFDRRAGELRVVHQGKPSLMQRFDAIGISRWPPCTGPVVTPRRPGSDDTPPARYDSRR